MFLVVLEKRNKVKTNGDKILKGENRKEKLFIAGRPMII
jgi:hypothetical protein